MRRGRGPGALVLGALLAVAPAWGGCRFLPSAPPAPPQATPHAPRSPRVPSPRPVRRAPEEVVVAAWAEPARLPGGGGEVQILVRAQKRSGRPFPGVEVRLDTSEGALYSRGHVLVTDAGGMTRDRLTTRVTTSIVLNAGGTRYKFDVPVGEVPERP